MATATIRKAKVCRLYSDKLFASILSDPITGGQPQVWTHPRRIEIWSFRPHSEVHLSAPQRQNPVTFSPHPTEIVCSNTQTRGIRSLFDAVVHPLLFILLRAESVKLVTSGHMVCICVWWLSYLVLSVSVFVPGNYMSPYRRKNKTFMQILFHILILEWLK